MNNERPIKVYIRDFETRSIVKEFDVTGWTESHYDRFEMGLLRQMNLDKYFLDDDEYMNSKKEVS